MTYLPDFEKQLDGTPLGGSNCTCASGAMAADYDSLGRVKPSSSSVRTWTGDTSGGTNLAQVDYALRARVNVDLEVRYRLPWVDFTRRIAAGQAAVLQGWYAPIRATRFRGSETFGGNHALLVLPGFVVMDPLCDGRRPGLYKYHGEPYPPALLREFAGKLNVGSTRYAALGLGLVYAAFTRDNMADWRVSVRPEPPATRKAFFVYQLRSGVIVGRTTRYTGGFSASCTAPRLYRWPAQSRSDSLVQVTSGFLAGQYVPARIAREV